jgi:hypothetical protein
MPAAQVARGVADDHGEQAGGVVGPRAERRDVGAREQGVKRILYDVERVGRPQALAARHASKPAGMVARQPGDPVAAAASDGRRGRHLLGLGRDRPVHYTRDCVRASSDARSL